MDKPTQLTKYNAEINAELKDPVIVRALVATTFKGLDATQMKQAILEGMIRGFTFKDFLEKNVYAIPFGSGYNLITSIDLARKRGARGGVNGKSAPKFTMDPEDTKKILSCAVTVYKKDGHPDGYTAEVYFEEYFKAGRPGKPSLWESKPRTMIAKVAEMHAMRMACPEDLSQLYLEEEFDKERPRIVEAKPLHEEGALNMGTFAKNNNENHEEEQSEAQKTKEAPDADGTTIQA